MFTINSQIFKWYVFYPYGGREHPNAELGKEEQNNIENSNYFINFLNLLILVKHENKVGCYTSCTRVAINEDSQL
jgi:hypothetical protein